MARRAVVAMSGGVDSSVVAALLKQRGYEVIGVTLNFRPCGFDTDSSGAKWCCGGDGNHRAKNAALHLGIRHYVLDCHKEFERAVLRHAWDEYSGGRTPSPCLSCNKDIKFGYLMDIARKQGAEILATGHYARITLEPSGAPVLLRGVDPAKDQSYFLFTLTNQQLAVASFPLGGMEKGEVRLLAREFGLPNADQPDSQDACFMSEEANFAESLRKRFGGEARPGEIVDISGRVLGKHSGIHNFTIGQRKGIGVFGGRKLYVSGIEHETARVVVSPDGADLMRSSLTLKEFVWTGGKEGSKEFACEAKIRSTHKPARCKVQVTGDGRAEVAFDEPQRAITPGQAVALYEGERVVGGGWINSQPVSSVR